MKRSTETPIIPIKEIPVRYANGVVALCSLLLFFTYLTVSLRMYTRVFINRKVGWDDVFILLSLLVFTCFCIMLPIMGKRIAGKNLLTESEMTMVTNMLLALEVFYIVTIAFFKLSFGLFFLRITSLKWQRQLVTWVLIIFCLFSTAYFFFAVFQCGIPHGSSFWRKKVAGSCVTHSEGDGMGYTHAILTAGSDFVFLFLPIPIVQQSNMKLSEKFLVGGMLALGAIGSIASLIRMKWVSDVVNTNDDFFYDGIYLAIWSAIEPGLGIIASSAATIRPLFIRWLHIIQDGRGPTLFGSFRSGLGKSKQTNGSNSKGFTSRGSTLVSTMKSFSLTRNKQTDTTKPGLFTINAAKNKLQSSFLQSFKREPSPVSVDRRSWLSPVAEKNEPYLLKEIHTGFYPSDRDEDRQRTPPEPDLTSHAEAMRKREYELQMKGRILDSRQRTGFSLGIFDGKESEEVDRSSSGVLRSVTLTTEAPSTRETQPEVPNVAPSISGVSHVSGGSYESYPIVYLDSASLTQSEVNRTSWHSSNDSGVLGRRSGV